MNKEGYHAPCRLLLLLGADSDDTRAFNWNRTDTTHFVGNEFSDPAAQGCGAFGQIPCRPSDAAMFTIPNDSSEFGYLARTESPSSGDNTGSRVIDTSNPRFTIGHRVLNPPQGDTVHKMGAAAGWTYGTIAQTCDEIGLDRDGDGSVDYIITCAYETDFRLDEGDSGGPVFYWSGGDNVTLVGVAFAHDGTIADDAGDGYFASLGAIDDDLGLMLVEDEPVNAFIPGPLTVPPDVECTFQSNVWGGRPPYSYQWSGVLSGTGPTVMGSLSQSGNLTLTVTDADSEQDQDTRLIEVDEETEECVA